MTFEGVWFNELGSTLTLQAGASGYEVVGTYESTVGPANGQYPLSGFVAGGGSVLGWAVGWVNSSGDLQSTTTWSGQYQDGPNGEEIVAMWLLTSETDPDDDWQSTLVGQDSFTRQQPSAADIERARARLRPSHPTC